MLHTSTVEPLTDQTAMVLSRWADEYQVEALKSICEEYLIKNVSYKSQAALLHAVYCNLPRRLRQCMNFMLSDLGNNINKLAPLAVAFLVGVNCVMRANLGKQPNPRRIHVDHEVSDVITRHEVREVWGGHYRRDAPASSRGEHQPRESSRLRYTNTPRTLRDDPLVPTHERN